MADKHRIVRYRGDTYPMNVTIKENGLPLNLFGLEVIMTIKFKTPVELSTTVTDISNGKVKINFNEEDVQHNGEFEYDIVVVDVDYQTTFVKNIIEFTDDINKKVHNEIYSP